MHRIDDDSLFKNMCSTPPLSNRNRRKRTHKPTKITHTLPCQKQERIEVLIMSLGSSLLQEHTRG